MYPLTNDHHKDCFSFLKGFDKGLASVALREPQNPGSLLRAIQLFCTIDHLSNGTFGLKQENLPVDNIFLGCVCFYLFENYQPVSGFRLPVWFLKKDFCHHTAKHMLGCAMCSVGTSFFLFRF